MNTRSEMLVLTAMLATLSRQAGIRDKVTDDVKRAFFPEFDRNKLP